jgi:hypothetical protein
MTLKFMKDSECKSARNAFGKYVYSIGVHLSTPLIIDKVR